ENYNMQAYTNGAPAALFALYQVPGSNALEVANRVKSAMARLAERFPSDMRTDLTLDTTIPVTEGAKEILITLAEAIGLVLLVVFVFLGSFRATWVPIQTIPVSLVGTFLFFPMLGFTINTLSLLGLVLAVGLVVDDAIVVVEAVQAKIDEGLTPHDAAIAAMDEVGGALLVLAAFAAFAVGLGKILPRSFMPQEDQGYFLVNVQLPEAASLQRTNAVMRKVDAILKEQPGVHYINSVSGFSILSQTSSPRSGLAFVQLAPYDERATPALQADAVVAALNAKLGALPDAQAVALLPPAIPGVGQAGGVDFFIQDRAGNSLDYLWQNAQRFMAELRNRPEIAFLNTTVTPAAPQPRAHADADRVLKLGVPIRDVYGTLQALLGGNFVNQFNRFGRVWRVFLEAGPQYRTDPSYIGLFYVRNANGDMVPLSTLVDLRKSSGPEFVTRF